MIMSTLGLKSRCFVVVGFVLAFASSVSAGPIFVNLSQFGINGAPIMSADGSTVVSTVPYANGQYEAAVWKWGSQAVPLGVLPGRNSSIPTGVSANGSVIVGSSGNPNPAAFRWSTSGGMQALPGSGLPSQAAGVSADGQTVVGTATYARFDNVGNFLGYGGQGVVWGGSGAPQFLQPFPPPGSNDWSQAFAISADATTVAGEVVHSGSLFLFQGSPSDPNLLNQVLPFFAQPSEFGITANGQMLYGTRVFNGPGQDGHSEATTWTRQGGLVGLAPGTSGIAPQDSTAYAASADGQIIGGSFGGPNFDRTDSGAMIWDPIHGFQLLQPLLAQQYGLSGANSWVLQSVTSMSADGMVLAGVGAGPNVSNLWLADLRNELANGNFEIPNLDGWAVSGQGSAAAIADPYDPGNMVAQLTTTSALSLSQTLATPNGPFDLNFDYQFQSPTGELDVFLGSTLVGAIHAPASLGSGLVHETLLVSDPSLWDLANTTLTLSFDPPQTSQILLDNFSVDPLPTGTAPEPSSALLLAIGCAGFLVRHRRRRSKPLARKRHVAAMP